MYVRTDSLDEEIRITVDAAVELTNVIAGHAIGATESAGGDTGEDPSEMAGHDIEATSTPEQLREVLAAHDFLRARRAGDDELAALADRCVAIARLVETLPGSDLETAVTGVNQQLEACAIAPSLSAHDGFALHIHWTSPSTPFAHQVAVDLLMAIAQTLCDHGTERFGRCGADGCDRVFYDATKNRSRRFCNDQRCASRTHTAAHRARRSATG